MKHLYRIIILLLIFIGSLYFMSRNIKEVNIELAETVDMTDATFPTVTLVTDGHETNLLHGYTGNLSATAIRERITPIHADKSLLLNIRENESEIKKIKYEVFSVENDSLLENGTIVALDVIEGGKSTKLKFKKELETGKEYALEVTLTSSMGKKIRFYTRMKYYPEDTHLKEKLEFVSKFHRLEFQKDKVENLSSYMETDYTSEETTLSCVTIHSSLDALSFGNLKVEKLTEPVPAVYEYNSETATVGLDYYIAADAGSAKPEIYRIKEYFRVRYTADQMYLLDYRRNMEAQFDLDLISVKKNEIKLGISNETDVPVVSSTDNSKMCFVRQGALWYYNLIENKAVSVFSFQKRQMNELVQSGKKGKIILSDEPYDFERNNYDQHDIQILNMDDAGNIDFMVYGYMNRGDYEGRVGIALYHFFAEREEIEEEVYIPVEKTYQYLKEEVDRFGYVNQKNVFYFSIDHTIYRYSIAAKKLEKIAEGNSGNYYQMVEEGKYFVWQNSDDVKKSTELSIRDLENESTKTMKAKASESIVLLGTIHENFIFGYVKKEDIRTAVDGSQIVPMYRVDICNIQGEILKQYEETGYYVTGISVKNNIITLDRISMAGGRIKKALPDNIINNEEVETESVHVTTRVTELAKTEIYLTFPGGFEMDGKPKEERARHVILEDDTTLLVSNEKRKEKPYYVYAYGEVEGIYDTPGAAILSADASMGTVTRGKFLIWEKGNYLIRNRIAGISPLRADSGDTVRACVNMMLSYENGMQKNITLKRNGVFEALQKNLNGTPVNLTGVNITQLFYFLSSNRPVIGMTSSRDAVLITGYDELYLYFINPQTGTTQQMLLKNAEDLFLEAGNVFISYDRTGE